jgi:hypothetical protein
VPNAGVAPQAGLLRIWVGLAVIGNDVQRSRLVRSNFQHRYSVDDGGYDCFSGFSCWLIGHSRILNRGCYDFGNRLFSDWGFNNLRRHSGRGCLRLNGLNNGKVSLISG